MCGERGRSSRETETLCGSSPRVRGTRSGESCCGSCNRFIPACAGNASSASFSLRSIAVHPRVCGERLNPRVIDGIRGGSSPRVRGTLLAQPLLQSRHRFIPACAGNAIWLCILISMQSVHPRVCGERDHFVDLRWAQSGSSPRVRGTPFRHILACYWIRFIPACAGNAKRIGTRPITLTVHPRVCGERQEPGVFGLGVLGSSPRVRGTLMVRIIGSR